MRLADGAFYAATAASVGGHDTASRFGWNTSSLDVCDGGVVYSTLRIAPQNQNHRIATNEHLADKSVLVDRFRLFLAFTGLREFGPHLLHVLEDHVAMPVERLHATKQFVIVPAVDQDLSLTLHALGEK